MNEAIIKCIKMHSAACVCVCVCAHQCSTERLKLITSISIEWNRWLSAIDTAILCCLYELIEPSRKRMIDHRCHTRCIPVRECANEVTIYAFISFSLHFHFIFFSFYFAFYFSYRFRNIGYRTDHIDSIISFGVKF